MKHHIFSTFSKNYERRFKDTDIFEKIFCNIVEQAISCNLVGGETFFTDSTHKKANANKNKFHEEAQQVVKTRRKWLEEEIDLTDVFSSSGNHQKSIARIS